jgi:sec-independent protein translocase protein TatC
LIDSTAHKRNRLFGRKKSTDDSRQKNAEMSFMDHLDVLRVHIVRSVIVWLVMCILFFLKIDWIFDHVILAPSQSDFITYGALCDFGQWLHLGDALCMPPIQIKLQGNTISGPFMAALNISMVGGLIVAFPYLFSELWRFVRPALSHKEIRYMRGSIFWVSVCFFCGALFGYFLLAPFTFNFLANFTLGTKGVYQYMPTLDDYISSLTDLILGCGIAFELPVLSYVLAKIGLISGSFLKKYRKYAVVLILIVAAVITPSPDWTSQVLVALPLIVLYEISVVIVGRVDKNREKQEKEWS